jgi:hypothetical protein
MTDSNKQENERQYRIVDQMMTAHAVLRDRFSRRARTLNLLLLSLAIILNAFVFASDDMLKVLFFGHTAEAKVWIASVSVALLVLAIIEFRVDWEGRSRSHEDAVERLSRLKASYREAHAVNGRGAELTREYARTMAMLPPIPERSFIRLKAYHKFKRLLSQELDAHPGIPAWLASLRLRWQIIRGKNFLSDRTHDEAT